MTVKVYIWYLFDQLDAKKPIKIRYSCLNPDLVYGKHNRQKYTSLQLKVSKWENFDENSA